MLRTSSLLRIGLQDPLEDVVAAQAPDSIVVDGVHTGAEGLLLQLGHPTSNQPSSHTQQQQQQQLQHSPGSSVFPGWWLTGARAGLGFWRDRVTGDRVQAVEGKDTIVSASLLHAHPLTPSALMKTPQALRRTHLQEDLSSFKTLLYRD